MGCIYFAQKKPPKNFFSFRSVCLAHHGPVLQVSCKAIVHNGQSPPPDSFYFR